MQNNYFLGPYNRGYLAVLCFFRGSPETRQPRYKNSKNNTQLYNYQIFCIMAVMNPSYPVILIDRGTWQPRYKKFCNYFYIAAVVFRGCRETLFGAYRGCRMAPKQVKFRLPRCRDLSAIIRSPIFCGICVRMYFWILCSGGYWGWRWVEKNHQLLRLLNMFNKFVTRARNSKIICV